VEPAAEHVVDPSVPLVVRDGVPVIQAPEEFRDVLDRAFDEQVVVVAHLHVDVAEHVRAGDGLLEHVVEGLSVGGVFVDRPRVVPAARDVVEAAVGSTE